MIVKQVAMRSLGKSDFAGLAKYITDAQNKDHRLAQIRISGCESGRDSKSLSSAIEEILATQLMNTRAKSDKTCHLIVSFRAGECPHAATLKTIEDRICAGLGYEDHQRISAVHNDTDNLHIHIAINKLHPKRLTIHEPYYPHRTLAELSSLLEKEFGLQEDNHEPKRSGSAGRARDMEQHAGVESLLGWIQRECLDEMRKASSWIELHQVMQDHGLVLRERGNGLVIEAQDGTAVKASSVGRAFSKGALEKRFGSFEPSASAGSPEFSLDQQSGRKTESQASTRGRQTYGKRPVRLRIDTTELYARYKAEQAVMTASRTQNMAALRRQKDRAVADAKRLAKLQRATLKISDGRTLNKKLLYGIVSQSLKVKLDRIHADYNRERARFYAGHKRQTWADWLQSQALNGSERALHALRSRQAVQGLQGNILTGHVHAKSEHRLGAFKSLPLPVDHITKKGSIIYRAEKSAIRDDGTRLAVSNEASRDTIRLALEMACQRYGHLIRVEGTEAFRRQVVLTAVQCNMSLVFADPVLEKARIQLSEQHEFPLTKRSVPKGEMHEGRRPDQRRAEPNGPRGGFASGHGIRVPTEHGERQQPHLQRHRQQARPTDRIESSLRNHHRVKPGVGRVASRPPAPLQHRVRNLPELGLVQHAQRGEVLLPGDVPDQLEQQKRKPDHELRRDVSLGSKPTSVNKDHGFSGSADRTRISGKSEISKISRYTLPDKSLTFLGIQAINGSPHALLKTPESPLLVPLDKGSVRALAGVQPGEQVRLTPTGRIRLAKGQHR